MFVSKLDDIAHQKLSNFLANTKLAKSNSEARRLIAQNAISINNIIISENINFELQYKNDIHKIYAQVVEIQLYFSEYLLIIFSALYFVKA